MGRKSTYLEDVLKNNANIIVNQSIIQCLCCDYKIKSKNNKINLLKKHLKSQTHKDKEFNGNNIQEFKPDKSEFYYDITKVFDQTGIHLNNVSKQPLINFFQKYLGRKLPHYNTVNGNYLNKVYQDILDKIRNEIKDKKLYFIIDETKDKR